jgi:hypothetical protein
MSRVKASPFHHKAPSSFSGEGVGDEVYFILFSFVFFFFLFFSLTLLLSLL